MLKLAKYLKAYQKQVILGPIFKMIEAIFELIVPLVMVNIIDIGIGNLDTNYILKQGGLLILLGVVGLASSLTCQFFSSRASQGTGTIIRRELFKHINTLSHAEIDEVGTPSLIVRLNNDINQVQLSVAMFIRLAFRVPVLVLGATIMAVKLDAKLSVIFLAAAIIISIILYVIMSKSVPFYSKVQRILDKVSLIVRENLAGVRVIRAFSRQEYEKKRFEDTNELLRETVIRVSRLSALLNPFTSAVTNISIIAIIWFGGIRVDNGNLTQGEVIALCNYMMQILLALIVLANLVVIFTKAWASAMRINEIFDTKATVTDIGNEMQKEDKSAAHIVFRNVDFKYKGNEENFFEKVNFEILRGETIGIIGGTGSGKSTLVQLIPRFYDCISGSIEVDGIDVKKYPFSQLREKIGMVPQQAVLFSGTIRENMKWRNSKATDEDIEIALKTAQASEFVSKLDVGLNHMILQGGKNLSGGQRQRLTIARALIGSPEILILDDSASALDYTTDAKLRKAIKEDTENMTVIMISQRANVIKDADKILVIDDGSIVGIGTHDNLFKNCEVYHEICLSQLSENEIKEVGK
jgi:ABC-type multidrug transport system, ATPase and permease components